MRELESSQEKWKRHEELVEMPAKPPQPRVAGRGR